jgi:hypothetical protein
MSDQIGPADAHGPEWWTAHGLSRTYRQFVAHEAEASRINVYQALFVPGLLQTEDYARAISADILGTEPDHADVIARVDIRMRRRLGIVERRNGSGPRLRMALDEAVLRRPIGSVAVMRAQLDQLADLAQRPGIELIVVPLRGHPGLGGTFELLEFAGPDDRPDVLFVESTAADFLIENPAVVQPYRKVMDALGREGLNGADAVAAIDSARTSLGG